MKFCGAMNWPETTVCLLTVNVNMLSGTRVELMITARSRLNKAVTRVLEHSLPAWGPVTVFSTR